MIVDRAHAQRTARRTRGEHRRRERNPRAGDIDRQHEGWRLDRDTERTVVRTVGVVIQPAAAAHGRAAVTGHVPRKADARREVLERRIDERPAESRGRGGENVRQIRVQAVLVGRDREELVARAEIQCQIRRDAVIVLNVETKERVGPLALELRARCVALEAARNAGQELRQVRKRIGASAIDRRQLAGVRMFDQRAGLEQVFALRVGEVVAPRPVVDVLSRGLGGVIAELRQTADQDQAHERRIWNERQPLGQRVGRLLLVGEHAGRNARRVEQVLGGRPLRLRREEMVARRGIREELRKPRRLYHTARHRRHLPRSVVRVADEQRILVGQLHVDPPLQEVLPRHARELVRVLPDARSEVASVRQRIVIEVGSDGGIDGARAGGRGRHGRDDGRAQIFLQPLDPPEEEDLVPHQRPAHGAPVLMAREGWRRAHIEEVARVHLAVAEELEPRPLEPVGARLGRDVDDAPHHAPVVGRKRVGDHAELLDRVDAQRRIGRRDRRHAGIAPHVGAVDQEAVRSSPHAVDVQRHAALRRRRAQFLGELDDARLQRREHDVVAPVQRQLLDCLLEDDGRERGRTRLDERTLTADGDGFLRRADLQDHVEARLLGDFQRDAGLHAGPEPLQHGASLVLAWRQAGHGEVPVRVGDNAPRQAGLDVPDDDVDAGQHAAGFVFDGAGDGG